MRGFREFLRATALVAGLTAPANAAVVTMTDGDTPPEGSSLFEKTESKPLWDTMIDAGTGGSKALLSDEMLAQIKAQREHPALGAVRVVPKTGDTPSAFNQVFAMAEGSRTVACKTGDGVSVPSQAYGAEVFAKIKAAGSLDALTDGTVTADEAVDITTLKRQGAYDYYVKSVKGEKVERERAQFGAGISDILIFVDGKMIDGKPFVEESKYTTSVDGNYHEALLKQIRDAKFEGKTVTFVGLSDLGEKSHTIVDTYQLQPSVKATFEQCLTETPAVEAKDYFEIKAGKLKETTPEQVATLIGSQCLRGQLRPEDVQGVFVINEMTKAIPVYSHAMLVENFKTDSGKVINGLIMGDYLYIEKDNIVFDEDGNVTGVTGGVHASKSIMQSFASEYTIPSCAGDTTVPVAPTPETPGQPPVTTTWFTPPPERVVFGGNPPGGGIIIFPPGGGGTNPPGGGGGCTLDCTPNPSPVPLPLGGILLASALGGMLAGSRRKTAEPDASGPKPNGP